MTHRTITEAKANLSELVAAAERGEEVIITRCGEPVVRLVSIASAARFRMGIAEGQVSHIPDFMNEEEVTGWT